MAGEIYIADKTTLDAVNAKATTLQSRVTSVVADKTTLDNVSSKIDTMSTQISSGRNYMKITELSKLNLASSTVNSSAASWTILSRSGSGYLYVATIANLISSTVTMTITLDGSPLTYTCNSTNTVGVLDTRFLTRVNNSLASLNSNFSYLSSVGGSNVVTLLPVPLRFESSASIVANSNTSMNFNYALVCLMD